MTHLGPTSVRLVVREAVVGAGVISWLSCRSLTSLLHGSLLLEQLCQRNAGCVVPVYDSAQTGTRDATNVHLLTEAMFGTAPMPVTRPSVKLHLMPSDRCSMVTRLFCAVALPPGKSLGAAPPVAAEPSHHRSEPSHPHAHAAVVPFTPAPTSTPSHASGSGSTVSPAQAAVELPTFAAASPAVLRDDDGDDATDLLAPVPPRSVACAVAFIFTVPETEGSAAATSELHRFVVAHFALLERHLSIFCETVAPHLAQTVRFNRFQFQQDPLVREAARSALNAIGMLCTAARLPEPLWLMPVAARADALLSALQHVQDLEADGRFISAAVTAVLAAHGGWHRLRSRSSDAAYDHLRLLYGAAASAAPTRVVVVGGDRAHVEPLLALLSLFVRAPLLAEIVASPPPGALLEPPAPGDAAQTSPHASHGASPVLAAPDRSPSMVPVSAEGTRPDTAPAAPPAAASAPSPAADSARAGAAAAAPVPPLSPPGTPSTPPRLPRTAGTASAAAPTADGPASPAGAVPRAPGEDGDSAVQTLPSAVQTVTRAVGEGGPWHRLLQRSLYASVCVSLQPDFVLQAVPAAPTYVAAAAQAVLTAAQHPLPGTPSAACCVLLHVPKRECDLLSADRRRMRRVSLVVDGGTFEGVLSTRVGASHHVRTTLQTVLSLHRAGLQSAACLAYVENRLSELQSRAELLRVYLREQGARQRERLALSRIRAAPISISAGAGPPQVFDIHFAPSDDEQMAGGGALSVAEVATALGMSDEDVPLLLAMVGSDEPELLAVVAEPLL